MENFLAVLVIFGVGMNNIKEALSAPAPQVPYINIFTKKESV